MSVPSLTFYQRTLKNSEIPRVFHFSLRILHVSATCLKPVEEKRFDSILSYFSKTEPLDENKLKNWAQKQLTKINEAFILSFDDLMNLL